MPTKRLYRSKKNRMLAGVCGGIAEYLNVDPNIIRLLFIVAAFFMGTGIIVYLAARVIIPEE